MHWIIFSYFYLFLYVKKFNVLTFSSRAAFFNWATFSAQLPNKYCILQRWPSLFIASTCLIFTFHPEKLFFEVQLTKHKYKNKVFLDLMVSKQATLPNFDKISWKQKIKNCKKIELTGHFHEKRFVKCILLCPKILLISCYLVLISNFVISVLKFKKKLFWALNNIYNDLIYAYVNFFL